MAGFCQPYIVTKRMGDPTVASVPLRIAANGSVDPGQEILTKFVGVTGSPLAPPVGRLGPRGQNGLLAPPPGARLVRVLAEGRRGTPYGQPLAVHQDG